MFNDKIAMQVEPDKDARYMIYGRLFRKGNLQAAANGSLVPVN
jgi:hypothetical protein